MMILVIVAAAFAAAYIFFRLFFLHEAEVAARRVLGLEGKPRVVRSALLKLSRPFYLRLMPYTNQFRWQGWSYKRGRQIVAAGMSEEITVDELWAYKFFLAVVACLLLFMFNHAASWWAWALAALAGFLFPDKWLGDRAKARANQITRTLPHVVDVLALSVEAGMDFMGAIGRVVSKSRPSPLIEEMGILLNEMRMGATRQDALRSMADRCDITDLSSFVAILIQADKLGVSIGKVLRAQSDKMRTERFQKAERQGALATQKILFPLILCIMPAVFIVIVGPLLLKYAFGY
jgi:tight adherence protein C